MARQQFYPSHARLSERRPRTYVPLPASHIICSRVCLVVSVVFTMFQLTLYQMKSVTARKAWGPA